MTSALPFPPALVPLRRWVPVRERSRSLSLVYSGMYTGSMLGLAVSPQVRRATQQAGQSAGLAGWVAAFQVGCCAMMAEVRICLECLCTYSLPASPFPLPLHLPPASTDDCRLGLALGVLHLWRRGPAVVLLVGAPGGLVAAGGPSHQRGGRIELERGACREGLRRAAGWVLVGSAACSPLLSLHTCVQRAAR